MTIVYLRTTGIYYDSRATKEISALLQYAEKVIVLGWDREGDALENCGKVFPESSNISFRFYQAKLKDGIGLKHIDKMIGWMHWVYKQLKDIADIDVIHACDLDAGYPAYIFCKRTNTKLVYDIYDYYVDTHYIPKIVEKIVEQKEINIINHSEFTIICTEERLEQINKANPKKVIIIHNSPEVKTYQETALEFDYAYFGGLNDERMIGSILQEYGNNAELKVCLGGFGKYSEMAKELSEKYNNFTFVGRLPYQSVLDIESRTKCLSAVYDPSWRNHRLCAPNKFYEALALGKPIIVCKGTGIDRIVEEHHLGKVINYNVEEFYSALTQLVQNSQLCKDMGERGRVLFEQQYNWEIMKERLISAYRSVMN